MNQREANGDCEDHRRRFLDHDWTRQLLDDAVKLAGHMHDCAACRKAAGEYDQVRQVLGSGDRLNDLHVASRPQIAELASRPIPTWFAVTSAIAPALVAACIGCWIFLHTPLPAIRPQPGDVARGQQNATADSVAQQQASSGAGNASLAVPPGCPVWTPEEVHRGVQVFQEVSATFEGRASWVALGDRSAEMGLVSNRVDPVGLENTGDNALPASNAFVGSAQRELQPSVGQVEADKLKVFLVRLAFFRGRDERSRTDLVIVAGQNARLELPLDPGRIVHYVIGTTRGTPPKLSLWAEVRSPHGGETVAVLATQMRPHSGETVNAGRIATTSGEYSLEVSFVEETLTMAPAADKSRS